VFERLAAARPRDVNLNVAASDRAGVMTFYEYLEGVYHGLSSLHPDLPGDEPELARREERQVVVRTLRDILAEHRPSRIDFMSVDVELHERQVLAGNDWGAFRPRVVLVEATEPRKAVPLYDSWEGILLDARYDFVYFDGLNRYYLRREDAALKTRFTAPPCVFDNYILAETVHLHERIEGLLQRIDEGHQEIRKRDAELVRIDHAYQHVTNEYHKIVDGVGERSLNAGLWLARQMSRMARVAGKVRRRAG
jgi:FkbM family methyltransferase